MGLSQRAYARARGVTHQTVRKAIARGRIPLLPDGTIDPDAADRTWPRTAPAVKHDVPRPGDPAAASGFDPLALERARAVKTTIEAQRAQLELDVRQGHLLARDVVLGRVFTYIRQLREAWQTWPGRVAAELAAELGIARGVLLPALEESVQRELEALAAHVLELPDGSPDGNGRERAAP